MAKKQKASKVKDITGKKITTKKKLDKIKGGMLARRLPPMKVLPGITPVAEVACDKCTCTPTTDSATLKQSYIDENN